jgi:AcrR family transcriptional regulator
METSTVQTLRPEGTDRRQQILHAAQDLIVKEGLEGFRIREVAERAGMHHASLLHYFPNREALVRGIVDRIVAQLDRVPAMNTVLARSPRDVLHAHFEHILTQMQAHPDMFVALNELFVRAVRDEDVRRVLSATDASWQGFLLPLLSAGQAAGAFRADIEPGAAALLITSFFKGLSMQLDLPQEQLHAAVDQLEQWITRSEEAEHAPQ